MEDAEPLAATAAGEAGQFQGLMATLTEVDHVPESYLVTALTAQCTAAQTTNPFAPVTPPPVVTAPTAPSSAPTTGASTSTSTSTTGPAPGR